jgi:sarcosine oxidase subunit beta
LETHDIGIVGAGIHGASAAYHLARMGVDAVLFERATPASGPTGLSSAVCRAAYTNTFLAGTARRSIAMLADFPELTEGGSADFHRTGMLYLYPPGEGAQVDALAGELTRLGVTASTLDTDALRRVHPGLDVADGETALWEEGAGHADPAGATQSLVRFASRHGVDVRLNAPIAGIDASRPGGVVLTPASGEPVTVGRLLIAAGPWTKPLAAAVGADLPLIVERHIVAMFDWAGAEPFPFIVGDVPGGYYLKPEREARFGLGSLLAEPEADPDDYQEEAGSEEALALAESAVRRSPALAVSEAAGGWGSLYDVSPDWQPVIGEIADGVFVSAGTSGHGFKLAPALGREITAMVAGEAYDPQLDQFSPDRFRTGALLDAGFGEVKILG